MSKPDPMGDGQVPATTSVLLVVNHQMLAESMRRLLGSAEDIEVVDVVGTVAEAVGAAATLRPDVVLMGYQLPDGDGVNATMQVMRDRPATRGSS